jgi:hypothetical protein
MVRPTFEFSLVSFKECLLKEIYDILHVSFENFAENVKRALGRPRHRWEYNIEMYLKEEIQYGCVNWMSLQ